MGTRFQQRSRRLWEGLVGVMSPRIPQIKAAIVDVDQQLDDQMNRGEKTSEGLVRAWDGHMNALDRREAELKKRHAQEEREEEEDAKLLQGEWRDQRILLDAARNLMPLRAADAGLLGKEDVKITSGMLQERFEPTDEDAAVDLGLQEGLQIDPKLEAAANLVPYVVMVFMTLGFAMYIGGLRVVGGRLDPVPLKLLMAAALGMGVGLGGTKMIGSLFEAVGLERANEEVRA